MRPSESAAFSTVYTDGLRAARAVGLAPASSSIDGARAVCSWSANDAVGRYGSSREVTCPSRNTSTGAACATTGIAPTPSAASIPAREIPLHIRTIPGYRSRNAARRTLPLAVFGSSAAKSTMRGYLYGAVRLRTCS